MWHYFSNYFFTFYIDTSAPEVTCPSTKSFTAARGQTTAVATWDPPQSVDSSGRPVTLKLSMTSPVTLSEGNHTIIVTATDANGNEGTCRFKISINGNFYYPIHISYFSKTIIFFHIKLYE